MQDPQSAVPESWCEAILRAIDEGAERALALFRERPFPVVLCDIVMEGMSGLDLLAEVRSLASDAVVVMMTSHASLETATEALRFGAYDFLTKPFDHDALFGAIERALASDATQRASRREATALRKSFGTLTPREREVFDLVVTGKPNKVIAYELGVSQRTVEIHRARVMEKMQAKSLADLVKMHMHQE